MTGVALDRSVVVRIAVCWVLLVAPLTVLGFGSDTDAWLIADVSDYIVAQGRYLRSRSTGFPLYELAVTPLVQAGDWYLSNQVALLGGLALVCILGALAMRGHYRHPVVVLTAFMFLPIVMKNGSVTMDYLPGLALLSAAYLLLLKRRFDAAAICVGLATGVRPSNMALLAPAALYVWRVTGRTRPAIRMLLLGAAVGIVAFSPSLFNGEFGLVRTMPALKGAYNALRLFGVVQTAVLALILAAGWRSVAAVLRSCTVDPLVAFHLAVIGIWALIFVPMPDEPEYLLPLVPSVLWLLDRMLTRRQFVAAAAVLLSYHVISVDVGGTRGGTRNVVVALGRGFTVADVEDRLFKMSLRRSATHWSGTSPTLLMEQALAITTRNPHWVLDPVVNEYRQRDGHLYVSLRYYQTEPVRRFREQGLRVVVMKSREWEFHQPERDTAWPYIDFVEDLGTVLGTKLRGRPLS